MNTITRNHNFCNSLTLVKKGRKYFSLINEKVGKEKILIDNESLIAFKNENWKYFENQIQNIYS